MAHEDFGEEVGEGAVEAFLAGEEFEGVEGYGSLVDRHLIYQITKKVLHDFLHRNSSLL